MCRKRDPHPALPGRAAATSLLLQKFALAHLTGIPGAAEAHLCAR